MAKKSFVKLFCGVMLLFTSLVLSQTVVCQWAFAAEVDTDVVADVQNALNNAGYDCGTADGVAGSKTTAAISQYQEDNGLAVSGTIDEELLISLGMAGPTMNGVTGDTDFVTSDSELVMTGYEIGSDYNDQDTLILYFTYTNSASTGRMAMQDFYLQVYQNGVSRDYTTPAYQASWQEVNYNSTKNIKDGASLGVAMGYVLENISDPVEIEVQEYVNYSNTWSFSINLTEGYNSNSIEVSDAPENPQAEIQAPEQAETEALETEMPETEAQKSEATESDMLTSADMTAADAVIYPAGQYKIGVDMNPGEYVIFAEEGESGNFKLSTDANGNDTLNSGYFDYDYIITVSEGEYLQLRDAYAVVLSEVESLDLTGTGMFKVGIYLAPGEYKLIADEEDESGHYAVYTDTVTKDYMVSQYFDNSTYVEVNNGEYLYLSDCHIENPEAVSDFSNPDEENEPVSETELETELITEQEIQTEEDRTVYAPATVLTGTIVEATMNTITVQTDDGATYLCATEDTEFDLVNGGITLGMEVEVTLDDTSSDEYGLFTADYVTDMTEDEETEAVETETETELIAEPEIQTEEDRTVYAPDIVLTGTIIEATMNTITVQTDDGATYLCATEDTEFDLASGGISLGMEVEVTLDDTTSDEYGLFQAKTITEEYTSEDVDAQSEDVDLFDDVFVYLAGQMDEATYQDGISYLDSSGIEYDADPPEDGYSGTITTSEDADGFKVIAFFSENYNMQDTLNLVAYSNGEYEVSVDDNYHTSGTVYNVYQKNAIVQNMEVGSLAALETFIHTDLPEIMNGNDSREYLGTSASTGTNYKLKYGELVSTSESKSDAGDVLIVKAKITSSYSNEATIDQNYKNVFDLIQNQGCSKYDEIQYWAVADMSNGEENKVVSFTLNKDLIQKIADDKIIDITLGDYVDDLYIHNSLRE